MNAKRTLTLLAACAFAWPTAGVATAQPIVNEHFHTEFSETLNQCGLTFVRDFVADGHELVSARTPEGLIYFHNNIRIRHSYTNVANNKTMTQAENFVVKDVHVTDNGDGTLTVITLSTGSFKVVGPDGKLALADPGQVRFEFVVDDGGTPTDPGDDQILSEELILGSTGRNDLEGHEFCEDLNTLIG